MLKNRRVIIGVALALLTAMAGGLYLYLTQSPLYSLWQAKLAFQQHNLIKFEKYVDVESLTERMIDQMTAANAKAVQKSGGLWEQLIQKTGQELVPMVKPRLVKRLQGQVAVYVETGKYEVAKNDSDQDFFTLQHLYQMGGGDNVVFRGIAYVKPAGKIAVVGLALQHKVYQVPMLMELMLRKRGGYWQVVEFNNLPDYLKKLAELEASDKKSGAKK
jgi:hypothetical protein